MNRQPRYRVTTWDMDRQEFTPQEGVKSVVHGIGGLKRALRALQDLGYEGRRSDCSILVERIDEESPR
jgi:hypothetical protein